MQKYPKSLTVIPLNAISQQLLYYRFHMHKQLDEKHSSPVPNLQPMLPEDSDFPAVALGLINKFTGCQFEAYRDDDHNVHVLLLMKRQPLPHFPTKTSTLPHPPMKTSPLFQFLLDHIFILYQDSEDTQPDPRKRFKSKENHPAMLFKNMIEQVTYDDQYGLLIKNINAGPTLRTIMALEPYAAHAEISTLIRIKHLKDAHRRVEKKASPINARIRDTINQVLKKGTSPTEISTSHQTIISNSQQSIEVIQEWISLINKTYVLPHPKVLEKTTFSLELKTFFNTLKMFINRMLDLQTLLGHEENSSLRTCINSALMTLYYPQYYTHYRLSEFLHSTPEFWESLLECYIHEYQRTSDLDTGFLEELIINLVRANAHPQSSRSEYPPILAAVFGCILYDYQQDWVLFLSSYDKMVTGLESEKIEITNPKLEFVLHIFLGLLQKALGALLTAKSIDPDAAIQRVNQAKFFLKKMKGTYLNHPDIKSSIPLTPDQNPFSLGEPVLDRIIIQAERLKSSIVPPPALTVRISETDRDIHRKEKERAKKKKQREKRKTADLLCAPSPQPSTDLDTYSLDHPFRPRIRAVFKPVADMPIEFQQFAIKVLEECTRNAEKATQQNGDSKNEYSIAGLGDNIKLIRDEERRRSKMKDNVYCKIRGEVTTNSGSRGRLIRIWGTWENDHLLFRHYQVKVHSGSPLAIPAALKR